LSASATEVNCGGAANVEEFRYSWHMRGGLRWIAGLIFPTSGVGNLKTVFPKEGQHFINSELLITAAKGRSDGYFAYESEMDRSGRKTLTSYSGYEWGSKRRSERTKFDYANRQALIHRETSEKESDKVRPIDDQEMRDVLTAIYYLRQNAAAIKAPITTSIYEGKEYPVVFRPVEGRKQFFMLEGKRVGSIGFEILDAPGGKKWPGNVKVWLSEDARRIPFRIEFRQSMASLQLDLQSIESCAFMQASK
jgi:hypothetical protein